MPAKGPDTSFARHYRVSFCRSSHGRSSSWTPSSPTPKVTTGPLPASQKIYVTPDAAPDISVPLREITLCSPTEPKVRVYDTTGPYTDPTIAIDVRKGLARDAARLGAGRAAASRNMTAGRSSRSTTAT